MRVDKKYLILERMSINVLVFCMNSNHLNAAGNKKNQQIRKTTLKNLSNDTASEASNEVENQMVQNI